MSSTASHRYPLAARPGRKSRAIGAGVAVGIFALALNVTSASSQGVSTSEGQAGIPVPSAGAASIPAEISQLAQQLHVPLRELADLADNEALPSGWREYLMVAHEAGDSIGRSLGLPAAQRALLAGQFTQYLLRIEREARVPSNSSFAELVEGVRRDTCQTLLMNLGDEVAAIADVVLSTIVPLEIH
jgi:hypothetical protein